MQLDRAAAFAGIKQGGQGAGIFPAGIEQDAAAAWRNRTDPHFLAGFHALREGGSRDRQPKGGRNSQC